MAGFATKKLGWFRTPSAYQSMTAWREKRAQMREKFEAQQATLTNAFAGAASNTDAANQLVLEAALQRIQAETKAKTEKALANAKLDTDVDSAKADIKDSIFSNEGSEGELDSGTSIDLDSGTITLSNGVVIDAKTGVKKVNIVV